MVFGFSKEQIDSLSDDELVDSLRLFSRYQEKIREWIAISFHETDGHARARFYDMLALLAETNHPLSCLATDLIEEEESRKVRTLRRPAGPRQSRKTWLYIIKAERFYKIGITISPETRLAGLAKQTPYATETILCELVDNAPGLEKGLHESLSTFRVNGEWFELPEQQVEDIKTYVKMFAAPAEEDEA
jgi:hypothetical protein